MIPMRTSSVFKSRWLALLWSAGILWFAYDVASSSESAAGSGASANVTDATGAPVTSDDENKIGEALNAF